MANSGEESNRGVDTTVGGLVWVCRKNGCWWPGQILDPNELNDNYVPTPRAGAPVKLLGRDDASVDWYNLEKSKRVKSFRCKEYEGWIKRVEKMFSLNVHKRPIKYARKDDAILHALQLEKARLGSQSQSQDDAQEPSKRKKQRPLTKVMECGNENVDLSLTHKLKENAEPTLPENNSSEEDIGFDPFSSLGSTHLDTANSGWLLKGTRKPRSRKHYPNIMTSARSRRNGPLRQARLTPNPKYDNSDYPLDDTQAASGLHDVRVEVETGFRPQRVPYISLMSQFSGRAITGHPLHVVVLKDDDSEEEEETELEPGPNEDVPAPVKRRGGPGRKPKRKRGGLLSKKTRMEPIVEKVGVPSVACVPLTVVFSRINADLNRTVWAPPRLNTTSSV